MKLPPKTVYLLFTFTTRLASLVTAHSVPAPCLPEKLQVRREWGDLHPLERKAYTDAVLCLQAAPSQLNHTLFNSTSRYEDFTAVHINYTRFIHTSGIFFAWHRQFVWLFEHELQQSCGYNGTIPYWDWVKNAQTTGGDITKSPLFDGSPYSMSGQGLPLSPEEKELELPCWTLDNVTCPKGPAGGCVTDGPFANYTIGYELIDQNIIFDPNPGLPPTVFAYTPRCFSRDLSQYIVSHFQTQENFDNLMSQPTIAGFQSAFDNVYDVGYPGLHISGHCMLGPVGCNGFSSPNDPVFYIHHSMMDKVWDEWQKKGRGEERVYGDNALSGTVTTLNIPPSENATFETMVYWDILSDPLSLHDLLKSGSGHLCYRYE